MAAADTERQAPARFRILPGGGHTVRPIGSDAPRRAGAAHGRITTADLSACIRSKESAGAGRGGHSPCPAHLARRFASSQKTSISASVISSSVRPCSFDPLSIYGNGGRNGASIIRSASSGSIFSSVRPARLRRARHRVRQTELPFYPVRERRSSALSSAISSSSFATTSANFLPLKPDLNGFLADLHRVHESRQPFGYTVQNGFAPLGILFCLLLALDPVPIAQHFGAVRNFISPKTCGWRRTSFSTIRATTSSMMKTPSSVASWAWNTTCRERIAQLFAQQVGVVGINRLQHLIGLFDEIFLQGSAASAPDPRGSRPARAGAP